MKKTRRTTEQIIRILRDSEGLSVDEACRRHEISAPTYHRWKAKYGGMGPRHRSCFLQLSVFDVVYPTCLFNMVQKAV